MADFPHPTQPSEREGHDSGSISGEGKGDNIMWSMGSLVDKSIVCMGSFAHPQHYFAAATLISCSTNVFDFFC